MLASHLGLLRSALRAERWLFVFAAIALTALLAQSALAAKGGDPGKPGGSSDQKTAGPSSTVSGTVTNFYTSQGIAGASVTFTTLTATFPTTTDADGAYTIKVPANAYYDVRISAPNYTAYTDAGSLIKGKNNKLDAVLTPVARVIVSASVSGTAEPGEALTATGTYRIMDGSALVRTEWTQDEGLPAGLTNPGGTSTLVELADVSDYAAHLVQVLSEPPITEADLPPDLVLQPINEIEKGLQDRDQVVAINPFALEKAEELPLTFAVTTTSGDYSAHVGVAVHLPWGVSTGVRTVPVGTPVLLYAKEDLAYDWHITGAPNGSFADLTDASTQTPWFTPDKVGTYEITENESGAVIEVHVGRYHGVIDPVLTLDSVLFGDGRPVADENCTGCHREGGAAPPNFDTWRNTGHAEAFTQGITTNSHFGENCFACHAVGFGLDGYSAPGGIDDTPNYEAFMAELDHAQHGGDISGLWETMLEEMPDTARLSNIQCESCHGPQDYTNAHKDQPGAPRVSLAADVCGSCHGEPARHGRFQQWQLSNHADYDLARSRGASSGNCARCHSGNGFVAWSKLDFDPEQQVVVTWNQDTVHPQTCATCHNPHDTGTTSGSDETDAKVRVQGSTHELLAGFMASNVGKGATCMTCHNSRAEYPRNDGTWAQVVANNDTTDRPHHGVQADLIMGQNMYFMATGELVRGKHSLIEDTCVTCHMNKTQPPDLLSYNQAGTNHTFAADPNICAECHGAGGVTAGTIDSVVTGYMDDLQDELGAAYKRMMEDHYPVNIGSTCGPANGAAVTVTDVVWNERATRLNITLSNGNSCTNRNPADITVDDGAQSLFDLSLAENNGATLKAAWNWSMLNEDQTINEGDPPPFTHRGVHNPDFAIKGLTRAISAVQSVAP